MDKSTSDYDWLVDKLETLRIHLLSLSPAARQMFNTYLAQNPITAFNILNSLSKLASECKYKTKESEDEKPEQPTSETGS